MQENIVPISLLLSADWFQPAWSALGCVGDTRLERVRGPIRSVILAAIASDNYWDMDRTPERIRSIYDEVTKLLHNGLSREDAELLLRPCGSSDPLGTYASLACNITYDFLGDRAGELFSSDDVSALQMSFDRVAEASQTVEDAARASSSDWDIYLQSLTPDLPDFLADFFRSAYARPIGFEKFWNGMADLAGQAGMISLIAIYSDLSAAYLDESAKFTAYLKQIRAY